MAAFRKMFGAPHVTLDARDGIGPHHLAIGKTRKLFEFGETLHAFFSLGYRIGYARLDADSLNILESRALDDIPIAWGGGAFCIDNDERGRVTLVFVHRNKHELCAVTGTASAAGIAWNNWRPLFGAASPMAAPWVEVAADGTAWCASLARDGHFRIGVLSPDGGFRFRELFESGETPWYHSCVQMLPLSKDVALAIGFRGEFPSKTELVFKTVSRDLKLGPSRALAPCNVNDQFTFHFQAVGDAPRERAHIVYLDDGLSVSHAMFEGDAWHVVRNVLPVPSYAPQITLNEEGALAFLAADYDGALWSAAWTHKAGWSPAQRIAGLAAPAMSGLFGRTGYGTGGLISAARTASGRVPFLLGHITDESKASAVLRAGSLGRGKGLELDTERPVSVTAGGHRIETHIRLTGLRAADIRAPGRCWLVVIPNADGRMLKLAVTSGPEGLRARLFQQQGAVETPLSGATDVKAALHDPFSHGDGAVLSIVANTALPAGYHPEKAWVETYEDWSETGRAALLADIGPFAPEAAAKTALDPAAIPSIFRRIV